MDPRRIWWTEHVIKYRFDILQQVQDSASSTKSIESDAEEYANVFLQVKRGML